MNWKEIEKDFREYYSYPLNMSENINELLEGVLDFFKDKFKESNRNIKKKKSYN